MLTVLIAMFALALVAPVLFSRLGRSAFFVLAAAPAAAFVWLLVELPGVLAADQAAPNGAPGAPPSWPSAKG